MTNGCSAKCPETSDVSLQWAKEKHSATPLYKKVHCMFLTAA